MKMTLRTESVALYSILAPLEEGTPTALQCSQRWTNSRAPGQSICLDELGFRASRVMATFWFKIEFSLGLSPVSILWSSCPHSRCSLSSSYSPDAEKWMSIVSQDTDLCSCTLWADDFGVSMVFSAWLPFRLVIPDFTMA